MRTRVAVLTVIAGVLGGALAPSGALAAGGPIYRSFLSPSGNIACMLSADGARCDIRAFTYKAPATPKSCHLAYGDSLGLGTSGKAFFNCHGDTIFGAYPKLAYGHSLTLGQFTCASASSGITCTDKRTRHGFFISRASYRLF